MSADMVAGKSVKTGFVFVLHFHQPHGNLNHVFVEATERCYEPTLKLLREYPAVKTGVHVSGPLFQWFQEHRPDLLELLRRLVDRGQVEMLGGGLEEPMLAILPDRDAHGQLTVMRDLITDELGAEVTGMWLAERVWEPDLARVIAESGYRYALLDDTHLMAAGVTEPHGYYLTDKAGHTLALLPIDRGLRNRIPFSDHDDLFKYLATAKGRVLTYGDDAEKFGLWPTTDKRVWKEKWLEKFCIRVTESANWLEMMLPRDVLLQPAQGIVYVPTISYAEMGAWALPSQGSLAYTHVAKRAWDAGFGVEAEQFLRGGIWQGFLAKYPESRLIYRKMLRVSAMVEAAAQARHPRAEEARRLLYKGQCNCAYWHGLFGGLYLQHLRAALMNALIQAEMLVSDVQEPRVTVVDHDGDLRPEVLLESPRCNVYLSPAKGGSAFEIDLCEPAFHLTGVLARKFEPYHTDVPKARVISDEELANISAHDLIRATVPNLTERLIYDESPRGAFVDHVFDATSTIDVLRVGPYRPVENFANAVYQLLRADVSDDAAFASLQAKVGALTLHKTISMEATGAVTARYRLETDGEERELQLGIEFDFTVLAPDAVDGRRLVVDARSPGSLDPGAIATQEGARRVSIIGEGAGVNVELEPSLGATLWRFPIETVSRSERGFEPGYQGTALVFVWKGTVGPGKPLEASLQMHLPAKAVRASVRPGK